MASTTTTTGTETVQGRRHQGPEAGVWLERKRSLGDQAEAKAAVPASSLLHNKSEREDPGDAGGPRGPRLAAAPRQPPAKLPARRTHQEEFAEVLNPMRQSLIYLGFVLLMLIGRVRDFLDRFLGLHAAGSAGKGGVPPIVSDSQDFYTRRLYMRIVDIFNRPITSAPGAWIDVAERRREGDPCREHPTPTGRTRRCLNLGSYNYLGFAANDAYCTPKVVEELRRSGASTCSPGADAGRTEGHVEMEQVVAGFLGVEKAFVYGMGFATNAFTIPTLCSKGCLVLSDEMNHKSIVDGVKLSGASVKVFRHNDVRHLEYLLRKSIVEGQSRTGRPWRKILIVVEGIYSMEGEMVRLSEIVRLKKKYGAYLYLDEAHSIGALGATGRGVCEQQGVSPRDVDVMMGTFTKSFGSCGGYIAGSAALVDYVRAASPASYHATAMSPPAARQIVASLTVISGRDGSDRGGEKLARLRQNANYFRAELMRRGFHVLGDMDSPVVPIMCYYAAKIPALSRMCLERNLAVVLVGFPATALCLSRMRICISASHTREELENAVEIIDEIGDRCMIKYVGERKAARLATDEVGGNRDTRLVSSKSI